MRYSRRLASKTSCISIYAMSNYEWITPQSTSRCSPHATVFIFMLLPFAAVFPSPTPRTISKFCEIEECHQPIRPSFARSSHRSGSPHRGPV